MLKTGKIKSYSLLAVSLLLLVGCGESPDIAKMEAGLVSSGTGAAEAKCFAAAMSDQGVKGEPYNYLANLLTKGFAEQEAINKTRRRFGADFKTPMRKARKECFK